MLLPPRYTQRSNAETHSAKGAARRISITRLQLLIRFAEDHNTTVFCWQVSAVGSVFRARQRACEWIVREEHGKTFRVTWIESEWSRSLSHSLLEEISPGSSLKYAFCLNFAVLKKVISLFYVAALARLGPDGRTRCFGDVKRTSLGWIYASKILKRVEKAGVSPNRRNCYQTEDTSWSEWIH